MQSFHQAPLGESGYVHTTQNHSIDPDPRFVDTTDDGREHLPVYEGREYEHQYPNPEQLHFYPQLTAQESS